MKGYKGTILFFKEIRYGHLISANMDDYNGTPEELTEAMADKWIYLGQCEVDVEFRDTRQAEIDAIDKQIEATRAELEARINALLGKKQELLALEGS